jgi:hypothetical protein
LGGEVPPNNFEEKVEGGNEGEAPKSGEKI